MIPNHRMAIDVHREIRAALCRASPARLDFTRKAFQMLPRLDRPRILDIGCGRGGPTIELAKLSNGEVAGLDIDQPSLDTLSTRIAEEGLSDRVRVVNCSMLEMRFGEESFDIIWAEASIHVVGFERGLHEWRAFLRPGGFLVIHEMTWLQPDPPREIADHWQKTYPGIRTIPEYIAQIPPHGYDLIGTFALPEKLWWLDYYGPLEKQICELRARCAADGQIMRVLEQEQREVDLYKKYSRWFGSAFLAMRKRAHRKARA